MKFLSLIPLFGISLLVVGFAQIVYNALVRQDAMSTGITAGVLAVAAFYKLFGKDGEAR